MYLIKCIKINNYSNIINVDNGVTIHVIGKKSAIFNRLSQFFNIELKMGEFDFDIFLKDNNIFKRNKNNIYNLTYTSSYRVKTLQKSIKQLVFDVKEKDKKIEGYIIMLYNCLNNVKTNGDIISSRDSKGRCIVCLKEGNYFKFTMFYEDEDYYVDHYIKVQDGKLYLMREL